MNTTNSFLKNAIRWIISILLVVVSVYYFLDPSDFDKLKKIELFEYIVIIFLTVVVYSMSGLNFAYIVYKNSQVILKKSEILLLPITMNLWSFIFPFQGSILYSTLLLKYKYNTKVGNALSTTLFNYLLATVMTGFIGVCISVINYDFLSLFSAFSILLLLSPLSLSTATWFFDRYKLDNVPKLSSFIGFFRTTVNDMRRLSLDKKTLASVAALDSLHLISSVLLNYYMAVALSLDVSLQVILLFTLLIRLSVIIRITPGNVGTQEILSGGIFASMSLNPADGVLLTLTSRITTVLLMCTLGILDTLQNSKYLKFKELFKYFSKSYSD